MCGSGRNVGTTNLCIAICNYICNKSRHHVAYIEVNATDEIKYLNPKSNSEDFVLLGIKFFPLATLASLPAILRLDFDFFVLDFGQLNAYTLNEYRRADIQLAVCAAAPWQSMAFDEFLLFLENNYKNYWKNITFIGNAGTKENHKKIHRQIHKDILSLPFFPNPFLITSEAFCFFEGIVERN